MEIWFNKKNNGIKNYHSKSISLSYHWIHRKEFRWKTNGAKKGDIRDTCFDLNIQFLGVFLNYTNWSFNNPS